MDSFSSFSSGEGGGSKTYKSIIMGSIRRFEDLIAWQKAQDLAVRINVLLKENKDWHFKGQIWRACISISNNIAEGFDRGSTKEFTYYLRISLGSCSEVKSMIYLGTRIGYFDEHKLGELVEQCSEISRIIKGLIKSLPRKEK